MRRVLALQDIQPVLTPAAAGLRRRFLRMLVTAGLLLIPWIAVLAITLPPRYHAGHWRTTWIGLDLALLSALALTAWAGARQRQTVILLAAATSHAQLDLPLWQLPRFGITTTRTREQ